MKKVEFQAVGRILRTQGAGGELKVRLYPGFFLKTVSTVYLRRGEDIKGFAVESFRPDRSSRILKLKGIDSQAEAEALTGRELFISGDNLPPAGEGCYFPGQLIGCRVLTKAGEELGQVREVIPVGESGLLVVEGEGREVYIPLAQSICLEIEPEAGVIRVDPPDGLLDLNEI